MELIDKLKSIMAQEFGITTPEELVRAVENMTELDIAPFVAPLTGEHHEKTA